MNEKSDKTQGASRSQVKQAFNLFMEDDENNVLALKGTWGTGKTYLVKKILSNSGKEYYYGSVFGLSSLSDIKTQLITNHINLSDKSYQKSNDNKLTRYKKNIGKILSDYAPMLHKIPKIGSYLPLTYEIIFSTIRKYNKEKFDYYKSQLQKKCVVFLKGEPAGKVELISVRCVKYSEIPFEILAIDTGNPNRAVIDRVFSKFGIENDEKAIVLVYCREGVLSSPEKKKVENEIYTRMEIHDYICYFYCSAY